MAYADYAYYVGTYLGDAVSETDFPRLALRASSFLDYYTQGRTSGNADLDALKMACCAIAERIQTIDTAKKLAQNSLTAGASSGSEIQSETVGSYSVTHRSGGDSAVSALSAASSMQQSLASVAREYLSGTGLLYRGRRC